LGELFRHKPNAQYVRDNNNNNKGTNKMKIANVVEAEKAAEKEAAEDCGSVLEIVAEVSAPAIYESQELQAYREVVGQIRTAALAIVADAETAKGRKELRSVAYAVARSKTTLDNMGKELVAHLKEKAKRVDLIRKGIRDELDDLKNEVLAPVDVWDARVRAVEQRIEQIRNLGDVRIDESADAIRVRLMRLEELNEQEFDDMGRGEELAGEVATVRPLLVSAIREKEQREAEQAELAKLREEKAKRDAEEARAKAEAERKAREQQIAAEAAERAKAEARAAQEAAELRAKEAEERAAKLEAERLTTKHVPARSAINKIRIIEDALMDEFVWLMPERAKEIAVFIYDGKLPGVEVIEG
jgi:hypothetical protein